MRALPRRGVVLSGRMRIRTDEGAKSPLWVEFYCVRLLPNRRLRALCPRSRAHPGQRLEPRQDSIADFTQLGVDVAVQPLDR
jgi:hypothetical protein